MIAPSLIVVLGALLSRKNFIFFQYGGGAPRDGMGPTVAPRPPRRCGFRRLRPGIPIERGHAFRSKAATCSDEGGRGVVAGMRSWVRFSWLRQDWRAGQ